MSEVTVTVRGEHEERVAPERATVRVVVRAEGTDRATVVDAVMHLTEPVRASIIERAETDAVVDWSSTQLAVRAERPWNADGTRLAPVYYASIDLTATFTAATELSIWVSDISAWDGVEIGWVEWHLTPETRTLVEGRVAAGAVRVAVARATAYAEALGLSEVIPQEIADVGLISPASSSPAAPMMMKNRAAAFASDAGPAMEYEPQEIAISATVEARFVAHG